MDTILMSLDSSTTSTGYAVFINGKYVCSGCIDLKQIKNINDRLPEMVRQIYSLMDSWNPNIVVTEEMAVSRNAQTTRILTMILGAIYGYCVGNNITYSSLRPAEWRKLINPGKKPRKRDELKKWSKQEASKIFGINNICDDISDQILIGVAYCRMWE